VADLEFFNGGGGDFGCSKAGKEWGVGRGQRDLDVLHSRVGEKGEKFFSSSDRDWKPQNTKTAVAQPKSILFVGTKH
jgi:hypothetical protein